MAKRFRQLLPALVLGALLPLPAIAQVEGPVEQGLAQLASQIVVKSKAANKTAIAVLPFPNADGSCSVLSNFIADELIQSLFNVPDSNLEIVERAQLEALIEELKLGATGLLDPETTKKLGSQSGVGALTVGTITVIGDTVRINARLIATDSGKAISAAAVDIPKVAAVSELLKQPITTGPTCAPRRIGTTQPITSNAPAASSSSQSEHVEAGGDPGKGEQVFKRCQPCHNVDNKTNKIGPYLQGVVGRKAGTAEGFSYSDAMKNSGLTWDEATLGQYLENPRAKVPGNKMAFPGLPREEDRQNVIEYLKNR